MHPPRPEPAIAAGDGPARRLRLPLAACRLPPAAYQRPHHQHRSLLPIYIGALGPLTQWLDSGGSPDAVDSTEGRGSLLHVAAAAGQPACIKVRGGEMCTLPPAACRLCSQIIAVALLRDMHASNLRLTLALLLEAPRNVRSCWHNEAQTSTWGWREWARRCMLQRPAGQAQRH